MTWSKWDLEGASWRKSRAATLCCVALHGNCSWPGATHGLAPNAWFSTTCESCTGCNHSSSETFHHSIPLTLFLSDWSLMAVGYCEFREERWTTRHIRGHPESLQIWFLPEPHNPGKREVGNNSQLSQQVVPSTFSPLNWAAKGSKQLLLFRLSLLMIRQVFFSMNLIYVFLMFEYCISLFHAQRHLETLLQNTITQKLGNPRKREHSCLCNSALLCIGTIHCLIFYHIQFLSHALTLFST